MDPSSGPNMCFLLFHLWLSVTEDTAGDQASIKTVKSLVGIEVTSDGEELVDLEDELGMSSPYAFLTVSLI